MADRVESILEIYSNDQSRPLGGPRALDHTDGIEKDARNVLFSGVCLLLPPNDLLNDRLESPCDYTKCYYIKHT